MDQKATLKVNDLTNILQVVERHEGNLNLVWRNQDGLTQPFHGKSLRVAYVKVETRKSIIGKTLILLHEVRKNSHGAWIPVDSTFPVRKHWRSHFSEKVIPVLYLQYRYDQIQWETTFVPNDVFLPPLKTALNRDRYVIPQRRSAEAPPQRRSADDSPQRRSAKKR